MEQKSEEREWLEPTAEIIRKKVAMQEEYEALLEKEYCDRTRVLAEALQELNETYDFCDRIFEENGKKGLMDIKGDIRVPALYTDFFERYDYDENRNYPVAAADESGKYALVAADGTGKPLSDFIYDAIYTPYFSKSFITKSGNKYGVISLEGKEIVPAVMDACTDVLNGIMVVEADGKEGVATDCGLYIVPEYDEISEKDDFVYARKGDMWGYFSESGEFIPESDTDRLDDENRLNYGSFI